MRPRVRRRFGGSLSRWTLACAVAMGLLPAAISTAQVSTLVFGQGDLAAPSGVACAPDGTVWVCDQFHYRIVQYSAQGARLRSVGRYGTGDGQFQWPYAITIDADGFLYVSDLFGPHVVTVFDGSGQFVRKFTHFAGGFCLLVDPSGMLVIDWGGLASFTKDGAFVSRWANELSNTRGVTMDALGNYLVVDDNARAVLRYSAQHLPVGSFETQGATWGSLEGPAGIAVASDGLVYVADNAHDRLVVFTQAGAFVRTVASSGSGLGQLHQPLGVAADGAGNVYVADAGNGRIERFSIEATPTRRRSWGALKAGYR